MGYEKTRRSSSSPSNDFCRPPFAIPALSFSFSSKTGMENQVDYSSQGLSICQLRWDVIMGQSRISITPWSFSELAWESSSNSPVHCRIEAFCDAPVQWRNICFNYANLHYLLTFLTNTTSKLKNHRCSKNDRRSVPDSCQAGTGTAEKLTNKWYKSSERDRYLSQNYDDTSVRARHLLLSWTSILRRYAASIVVQRSDMTSSFYSGASPTPISASQVCPASTSVNQLAVHLWSLQEDFVALMRSTSRLREQIRSKQLLRGSRAQ